MEDSHCEKECGNDTRLSPGFPGTANGETLLNLHKRSRRKTLPEQHPVNWICLRHRPLKKNNAENKEVPSGG